MVVCTPMKKNKNGCVWAFVRIACVGVAQNPDIRITMGRPCAHDVLGSYGLTLCFIFFWHQQICFTHSKRGVISKETSQCCFATSAV